MMSRGPTLCVFFLCVFSASASYLRKSTQQLVLKATDGSKLQLIMPQDQSPLPRVRCIPPLPRKLAARVAHHRTQLHRTLTLSYPCVLLSPQPQQTLPAAPSSLTRTVTWTSPPAGPPSTPTPSVIAVNSYLSRFQTPSPRSTLVRALKRSIH